MLSGPPKTNSLEACQDEKDKHRGEWKTYAEFHICNTQEICIHVEHLLDRMHQETDMYVLDKTSCM